MKIIKFTAFLLCVFIIQSSSVIAKSSNNDYSKEELRNLTPGWSNSYKDKSEQKINSDRNPFSTLVIDDDDDDDDDKENEENKYDQINTPEGTSVIDVSHSTGRINDFWGQTPEGDWMLIDNGTPVVGWKLVKGYWYYMNDSGIMQTGWIRYNGDWYCLYSDGKMARNTNVYGYYVDNNGVMR